MNGQSLKLSWIILLTIVESQTKQKNKLCFVCVCVCVCDKPSKNTTNKMLLVPGKYNSESLVSKLFRTFHIPAKKLLPPVKAQFAQRTLVVDIDTICHSTWSV